MYDLDYNGLSKLFEIYRQLYIQGIISNIFDNNNTCHYYCIFTIRSPLKSRYSYTNQSSIISNHPTANSFFEANVNYFPIIHS